MKKYKREDGFSEIELIHSAIDHLASAKILFKEGPRCFDSAGYLSHLGIELILKAILLNKTNEFANEHSLIKLTDEIEKQGIELDYEKKHKAILNKINQFYDLRYPKVMNPVEIGDNDWDDIENLFELLMFAFPKEIQQKIQNINHSEKGNRILMKKKIKE